MERFVYIRKNIRLPFIEFAEALSPQAFSVGETWEDYLYNQWVRLSDAQIAFHEVNPTASIKEVWNMRIMPVEKTLEEAIQEKLNEIDSFDNSSAVNSFLIGEQQMWLTFDERSRLRAAVEAKKKLGRDTMTKSGYTFTLEQWEGMLATLEEYANDCADVTEGHKTAVRQLESIEEIENYNYMTGYPTQLVF